MSAKRKARRPITTKRHPGHAVAPNLLQQDFTAERPNQKWTGDLTYIPTAEGWLYLAVILDRYSRLVVGWSMSAHCDELLVEMALRMALARRRPAAGLLHHTDRGSQYTSHAYRQVLEQAGIVVSMSGKGNCYDNAATESFLARSKTSVSIEPSIDRMKKHGSRFLSSWRCFIIGSDGTRLWAISAHLPLSSSGK